MFRSLFFGMLFLCPVITTQAQEFATIPNTYHVEVRVEHWRFGNPSWVCEFTTNEVQEAELMLGLFELAMEQGVLAETLGYSWQWLISDVRIRTEYSWQLTAPIWQPPRLSRIRPTYLSPTYSSVAAD